MTQSQLNHLLSKIAEKEEHDIKRVCKEGNIFFPPAWYTSIRGSHDFDYILKNNTDKHD